MKKLLVFIYAILAGMAIAFGGVIFLCNDNKVVGALFFTVGLFTVCVNGLNLYTGKICYLFDNPPSFVLDLVIIWFGNLIGSVFVGYAIRMTRMISLAEKAKTICTTKLNDNLLSIFILSAFCGIMIFIAVDSFKNNPHEFGKYLGLLFCVPVFIVSSYEHCVANMLYFSVADLWSAKTFLYVIVMTLGNSVGGVLFPLARKVKIYVDNQSKASVPASAANPSMAGKR